MTASARSTRSRIRRELEALVGRLGRLVPVGDDQAAERVGRGQRHEVDGLERAAPQVGVDADARRAAAVLLLARTAAEHDEALLAGDGAVLVAQPLILIARARRGLLDADALTAKQPHDRQAAQDPGGASQ